LKFRIREIDWANGKYNNIEIQFYIYSTFIHPIINDKVFLLGINQLLFNFYGVILLPPEGSLPSITLIWIPSFLFVFSEIDLTSIDEIKSLNIQNSLGINRLLSTKTQNINLLYLVKSVLNKQVNNMDISQRKQRRRDFIKLVELFQKDSMVFYRMSYQARNWDKQLKNYCLSQK